jgi:hypothetical protein
MMHIFMAHELTTVANWAVNNVEDSIGSTWASDAPALKFCKRNFRTPAWVNNVTSLHVS